MPYDFEFARWMARLRAPLLAALILVLASCNSTDSLTPDGNTDPEVVDGPEVGPLEEPSFSASSYAGGIPMGLFHTPSVAVGSRFNGTLRNIYPNLLLGELRAIKSRGGKVMLVLPGAPRRYTDRSGNFSMAMWKASVDRYKGVNFNSYINDGTIIGIFLIDEPNDRRNWRNRRAISPGTVEEMARYSKARWPGMATIARVRPDYLLNNHRYLDAAWSQYHSRFGDPRKFIDHDAAIAKRKGLALVVGMNVIGGNHGRRMTASQIKSWGAALLSNSYPCAFLSWKFYSSYLSSGSMREAMSHLRSRAQGRGFKSCRG
jgi:hypothetical protein